MNEHLPQNPSPAAADDVWGVHRPPVLGPTPTSGGTSTAPPAGAGGPSGPSPLDRSFDALRRVPLRRDSDNGVIGGVCAGIARRLDVSPTAVRVAAVALALFFGVGIGAYLLAWAALPDQGGRTHAEQAVRGGRPRSLVIVGLGVLAALGIASWALDSWPLLLVAAVVAVVVMKKKGHFSSHAHG